MTPEIESNHRSAATWYAVRVRSQRERLTEAGLQARGYEVVSAMAKSRRVWSDRFKDVEFPLFPGYIFVRFDPAGRLGVITTPGVIEVVGFGGRPVPVEDSEIEAIRTIVRSGLYAERHTYLAIGSRVRVRRGPLKDIEGLLTGVKSQHRLVVSVTLLQRSVAVEISEALVEPILLPMAAAAAASRVSA